MAHPFTELTARLRMAGRVLARGAYDGAKTGGVTRRWTPTGSRPADTDTLADLPTLRARSRDAARNNPIVQGALDAIATHVVGPGLTPHPKPNRDVLGWSPAEAQAWERQALALWQAWAAEADPFNGIGFAQFQRRALVEMLTGGDCFIQLLTGVDDGRAVPLALQLLPAEQADTPPGDYVSTAGGIERSALGIPIAVYFRDSIRGQYPRYGEAFTRAPFFDDQNNRQILHLHEADRTMQSRGVPALASVLRRLYQLERFDEAELQAAVLNASVALVDSAPDGQAALQALASGGGADDRAAGPSHAWVPFQAEPGMILSGLAAGQVVRAFESARPNANYAAFCDAIFRLIALAFGLTFETLMRVFNSSYSASRAAIQESYRYHFRRRSLLVERLCRPIWVAFLREAIAAGALPFVDLSNARLRAAITACEWSGPPVPQLDPVKEVVAVEKAISLGLMTRAQGTRQLHGHDFEQIAVTLADEYEFMRAVGLTPAPAQNTAGGASNPPSLANADASPAVLELDDQQSVTE